MDTYYVLVQYIYTDNVLRTRKQSMYKFLHTLQYNTYTYNYCSYVTSKKAMYSVLPYNSMWWRQTKIICKTEKIRQLKYLITSNQILGFFFINC